MLSPELRKILIELKPFKKIVIIVAITGIIAGATNASLAYILKFIIDGLNAGKVDNVVHYALIAVGLSLLTNISRYLHIFNMNYIAECVGQKFRQKLLSHFLKLNLGFHNGFDTGSGGMLSRILADASMIQTSMRMIADIFLHPIQLVASLGFLFHLDWKLTLYLFAILPILALFHRSITRSLRKYIPIGQKQIEIMTSTIKEALDGVRTIQSYNLENKMDNKLLEQSDEYLHTRRKVHSRIELSGPFTEFLATCLILAVMVYVAYEVSAGRSTPGTLLAYVASIMTLSPAIKKLQENLVRIQELKVSAKRIYDILEDERTVPEAKKLVPFPKDWKTLSLKKVNFSYGDRKILNNINLQIPRGKKIALVGESGSGKSTILNLIERFFDADSGDILFDETKITDIPLKELRNQLALVSQDVFLFRESISRNVAVTKATVDMNQVKQAAEKANAATFVARLDKGFDTNVGDRGVLLSGGEKQRISIARAILKDADILLLDEATSALDSESEKDVQASLESAMQGKTSIIVSHRLSTIQNVDCIHVLQHGQIAESGTHEELIQKKGLYFKFWTIQSMGG